MKISTTESIKLIIKDRQMVISLTMLFIVAIIFIVYVGLNVHPNELKVVTHYSAFGSTNFYRDKWYYLITFVLFGLVVVTAHTAIAGKLFVLKGRELALAFIWMSIVLLGIAVAIIYQVLKIAALA